MTCSWPCPMMKSLHPDHYRKNTQNNSVWYIMDITHTPPSNKGSISQAHILLPYVKRHFKHVINLCEFVKTGLLINDFFLHMSSSVLCIVIHDAIKKLWHKFMRPALDSHNSHKQISCINLSLYVSHYLRF